MLVRASQIRHKPSAENGDAAVTEEPAKPVSPGQLLQEARIAMNLSEQAVAEKLRLSERWIRDIEADNFSRAPALIYMRGYLRAYARLVEAKSHHVLQAFEAMGWREAESVDEQEWLRGMGEHAKRERMLRFNRRLGYGFLALIVVVLLALGILWWVESERRNPVLSSRLSSATLLAHHSAYSASKHLQTASVHRRHKLPVVTTH